MAGYKLLKRKGGVDQISDDFSDFSLSSPATKIRRLDGGVLPPIVEEEEPVTVPLTPSANEERALVLFKPIHHSPSSFSLTLDSDLISEIKNQQLPWSKQCDYERLMGSHEEEQDNNNRRLAIVPWVPQQQPSSSTHFDDSADSNNNTELMEADEMGVGEEEGEGEGVASMMMDVEQQDTATVNNSSTFHYPTMLNDLHQGPVPEGFQHQQHCLLPQLPQNTSTPITWTR